MRGQRGEAAKGLEREALNLVAGNAGRCGHQGLSRLLGHGPAPAEPAAAARNKHMHEVYSPDQSTMLREQII